MKAVATVTRWATIFPPMIVWMRASAWTAPAAQRGCWSQRWSSSLRWIWCPWFVRENVSDNRLKGSTWFANSVVIRGIVILQVSAKMLYFSVLVKYINLFFIYSVLKMWDYSLQCFCFKVAKYGNVCISKNIVCQQWNLQHNYWF